MLIKYFTVGSYETNCYIVTDERTLECAVIDPGADAAAILDYLEEHRLQCRFILLTHGHFDHVGAVPGAGLLCRGGDRRVRRGHGRRLCQRRACDDYT